MMSANFAFNMTLGELASMQSLDLGARVLLLSLPNIGGGASRVSEKSWTFGTFQSKFLSLFSPPRNSKNGRFNC